MDQAEFTGLFAERPENFAWFLGAGASRSCGLPTATDVLWDMKRRYYTREENREISRQEIQNDAVKERIQSFVESRGFPPLWADDEYPACFEKIFGDDKERQRRYIHAILSEDKVRLSVGNSALGAMMTAGLSRAVFTTNFDSVVEKAVAEVGKKSLAAFHLEGSQAAVQALNNEEYPIYVKLHGDFRYDSLKNLPEDLAKQNEELSRCLVNAGNRFGFVVTGYSGRDESIMRLFHAVLETLNPFPHGFFWTGMKGGGIPKPVNDLLAAASAKGVSAHHVPIETFDAFLLRLWRNIERKPPTLDAEVRKARAVDVNIPLPPIGNAKPLLRFNALPIVKLPTDCQALWFRSPKDWDDLRAAERAANDGLILTKGETVWCWGTSATANKVFGDSLVSITPADLPRDLDAPHTRFLKGFVEAALCSALARGKPVFTRTSRSGSCLVSDPRPEARAHLKVLQDAVGGATTGVCTGLATPITEEHPKPERVTWSEALRISFDVKNGQAWLLIEPDIWVFPPRARAVAVDFLDKRKADRFNSKYNSLISAWLQLILGTDHGADVTVRPFVSGSDAENPPFTVGTRTGFSRKRVS